MIIIDIIDAGEKGALEYHVRIYDAKISYDKQLNSMLIESSSYGSYTFVNIKIENIESEKIVFNGSEMIRSGTGELPPLRRIIIRT